MKWRKYTYRCDGGFEIVMESENRVVYLHHMPPDDSPWYMQCPLLDLRAVRLYSETFDDAVKEAQEYLERHMAMLSEKVYKVTNDRSRIYVEEMGII